MTYSLSCSLEPMAGFEPATYALRERCSAPELHWLKMNYHNSGSISMLNIRIVDWFWQAPVLKK